MITYNTLIYIYNTLILLSTLLVKPNCWKFVSRSVLSSKSPGRTSGFCRTAPANARWSVQASPPLALTDSLLLDALRCCHTCAVLPDWCCTNSALWVPYKMGFTNSFGDKSKGFRKWSIWRVMLKEDTSFFIVGFSL